MTNSIALRSELERAVRAYLEEDARLMQSICSIVGRVGNDTLTAHSPWQATRVTKWWKENRDGFPSALAFLADAIHAGHAPVFAGVSLCVASSAPTLYVPVPYPREVTHSFESLRRSIWCNAPKEADWHGAEAVDWGFAVRSLAHAMANISYSVRVGDRPTRGFLAHAHETCRCYYIPDTTNVENLEAPDAQVESVATNEERMLGMASALFVPLVTREVPATQIDGASLATAVLMLWSPIPHLWDGLYGTRGGSLSQSHHNKLRRRFGPRLGLLGAIAAGRERADHALNAEVLGVVGALDALTTDGPDVEKVAYARTLHGLQPVLEVLRGGKHDSPCRVADWLEWFLGDDGGAINKLSNNLNVALGERPLLYRDRTSSVASQHACILADWRELTSHVATDTLLPFDLRVAQLLTSEPVVSISKHCDDIASVHVEVSRRYVTTVIRTAPSVTTRRSLVHSSVDAPSEADAAFLRYYGARRGLPLWSVDSATTDSLGLGMFLHGLLSARFGVYQRLFVSADGQSSSMILAMPYSSDGHDIRS